MNKLVVIFLSILVVTSVHASKLSKFLNDMDARENARVERERKEDLNFSDYAFKLDRRFQGSHGDSCREYVARSRSNPFKSGRYIICDGR